MTARRRPGSRGHRAAAASSWSKALTTLALGALVIAGLAGVIVMMLRFSDRTAADLQRREVLGRAVEVLEREIRAMTRVRLGGRGPVALSSSRAARTACCSPSNEPTRPGSPRRWPFAYRIGTATASHPPRLRGAGRQVPPAVASVDGLAFGKPGTLYAGDRGLSFAYFSTQADGSGEVLVDD